jgi:hypothetical protein
VTNIAACIVVFAQEAVIDFEDVKSKTERKAVFNAVAKLTALGPDLPSPHMKSLKGAAGLYELRPRQGSSPVRPIYARSGNEFVVLAVARDKTAFDPALADAIARKPRYCD